MHICIYFSRCKTAQYLPAFLRKITKLQHMVPRSFMTKGPALAYFSSFASGHASSLHSMVQPHCNFVGSSNAPHTVSPLDHSSAQTFLFDQNMVHVPLYPTCLYYPFLLISAQIPPSGQLSLIRLTPFRCLPICSYSTWHFTYNSNDLIL